jgi:hypothetical protein
METMMDTILGGLAFGGLIAAQFLAVISVHQARLRDEGRSSSTILHRKLCQPDHPRLGHSDRSKRSVDANSRQFVSATEEDSAVLGDA